MPDFFETVIEFAVYGLKGVLGLLALTGGIAMIGAVVALILAVIANIIFWPIYLTKRQKNKNKVQKAVNN